MICSNCGKEIPEISSYCKYCGNKVNVTSKKKTKTIILLTVGIIAVAVALLTILVFGNNKASNINEETTIDNSSTETLTENHVEVTSKEETTAESYPMDSAMVRDNFNSFLNLYYEWLDFFNVRDKHTDQTKSREIESVGTAYSLDDKNLKTIEDIKLKFKQYCTDDCFDKIPYDCTYRTIDGKLCLIGERRSVCSFNFIVEKIKKSSDTKYIIKTLYVGQECGPPTLRYINWSYELFPEYGWKLSNYEEIYEWGYSDDESGWYTVSTNSSNLNIREYPSTEAEIVTQAKKGHYIYCEWFADKWAYITYSVDDKEYEGWVKSEYITPYYGG